MNTQIANINVTASFFSRGRLFFLLLGVWMLLTDSRCCAQGALYTDRSIFNAALQSSTTITFTDVPDTWLGRTSVTVSGVTFTNFDGQLYIVSGAINNFDSSYPMGVFLPGGRNAFGADFSGGIDPGNNPFSATITVNLVGGQTFTYNFTGQFGTPTFVGMVFPQAISSLIYDDGAPSDPLGRHQEMLDNVIFGVAVPEPQTSLLVVFGFLTSFGVPRLRKQKSECIYIRGQQAGCTESRDRAAVADQPSLARDR